MQPDSNQRITLPTSECLPEEASPFARSFLAAEYELPPPSSALRAQFTARRLMRAAVMLFLQRSFEYKQSFAEAIEALRYIYTNWMTVQAELDAAARPGVSLLRRLGALDEHRARLETVSVRLDRDLDALRMLLAWDGSLHAEIETGQIPDDPDFRASWAAFLERYGRRALDELDFARPRFEDAPTPVLAALLQPKSEPTPPLSLRGWLTLPIWLLVRRHVSARDLLRHRAMIAFAYTRTSLLKLADQAVTNGQLPDRDALWLLEIEEVLRLDEGWMVDADLIQERGASADVGRPSGSPLQFTRDAD